MTTPERAMALGLMAINKWGVEHQMNKLSEELCELLIELGRNRNAFTVKELVEQSKRLVDELADVYIMVAQMTHILGPEIVDKQIHAKLDRLEQRIFTCK